MNKKAIATIAITATLVVGTILGVSNNKLQLIQNTIIGNGQDISVTSDTQLSGNFGTVTISGNGLSTQNILVTCDTNAIIKNFVVSGNYVTLSSCNVTGSFSHAIIITGNNDTIANNTVHDAITENGIYPACGNGQWGSGIKAERGSHDLFFKNNTVYRMCGEGIASTMSYNNIIDGNTVYDSWSVNIYVDNSYFVQVSNNNSYCTKSSGNPAGIALGEEYYNGWGAHLHDIKILNNTLTNCSSGFITFSSMVSGTLVNATIDGNVIPSAQSQAVSLDNSNNLNVVVSNNQWYKSPWIRSMSGVTLLNNNIISPLTSIPPTRTNTPTVTLTRTPTITRTSTPSPTNTLTPTITPTPIQSNNICVIVTWNKGLSLRPSASMLNSGYTNMNFGQGAIFPVEKTFTNSEGKWMQINPNIFSAMYLNSNNRTYAMEKVCP